MSSLIRTDQVVGNLKKLPKGWGGEQSKKPTIKAVKKTKRVLSSVELGRMPWPGISAALDGSIVLTWISWTRDITMTIDQDGDVQFITSLKRCDDKTGQVIDRLDSEGAITDIQAIDHILAWYCLDKSYSA